MHVAAAWVVVAFILGGGVGIVIAALLGASKMADAKADEESWFQAMQAANRKAEQLQLELTRLTGERRAAGRRQELASVLADEPGARPVGPCPAMAVHEGAEKYPFAAAAGLTAPTPEDVVRDRQREARAALVDETHEAGLETLAAAERDDD